MAFERVSRRARGEESTVRLGYLSDLHQLHEEWLGREHTTMLTSDLNEGTEVRGSTNTQTYTIPKLHHSQVYTINADLPLDAMYLKYEECLNYLDLLNA